VYGSPSNRQWYWLLAYGVIFVIGCFKIYKRFGAKAFCIVFLWEVIKKTDEKIFFW
jgi:hypothetical protein